MDLHERLWHVRLLDPAGGAYQWNEALGTMASTTYGCPEAPKVGPVVPLGLEGLRSLNLGVSFERGGLRARAEMRR